MLQLGSLLDLEPKRHDRVLELLDGREERGDGKRRGRRVGADHRRRRRLAQVAVRLDEGAEVGCVGELERVDEGHESLRCSRWGGVGQQSVCSRPSARQRED